MKKFIITALIFLLAGYWLGGIVQASAPLPGSPEDPVITKSYADKIIFESRGKLSEQISYLQQQVKDLEEEIADLKQKVRIRIVLTLGSKTAYIGSQEQEMEVAPFQENGRTMLPFRFIGEALGAEVSWIPEENSVQYRLKGQQIKLTINSNQGEVNGEQITLDVPPQLLEGRTVVPVRVVSEYLGASVDWNDKLQQVTIIPQL